MAFNLLEQPFFPVLLSDGSRTWLSFPELVDLEASVVPVAFAWPREDLNIAAYELSIGVMTLAFQPRALSDWSALWSDPPRPDDVRAKIEPFVHAFEVVSGPARFMQFDGVIGQGLPIDLIMIDANEGRSNTDVLTKAGRYPALGIRAASIALYALQQFAPAGGRGHRTSLRGGGPLSTLVIPSTRSGEPAPLWKTIMANVVWHRDNEWRDADLPRIFPWLAASCLQRVDEKVHQAKSDVVHRLHAFFGMPRRIALEVSEERDICPISGERELLVTRWTRRPYGIDYGVWKHPLTPYKMEKGQREAFSVKPQSRRYSLREWTAHALGRIDESVVIRPAPAVASARLEARMWLTHAGNARMLAAGWVVTPGRATAETFLVAEAPLHLAVDVAHQAIVDAAARQFADVAGLVASALDSTLRDALFGNVARLPPDAGLFKNAREAFYEAIDDDFHASLGRIADGAASHAEAVAWLEVVRRAAYATFEEIAPLQANRPEYGGPVTVGLAYLHNLLSGYGVRGIALFRRLGLAAPKSKPRLRQRS